MLPTKDFDTILQELVLKSKAIGFDSDKPDTAIHHLLSVLSAEFEEFYNTLEYYYDQSFVSTATGENLDKIGYLLNCTRLDGEDDDSYRYRIINQVLAQQKANRTSIEMVLAETQKVQDYVLKENYFGPGSFVLYIIPEPDVTDYNSLIEEVTQKIEQVKAFGVKYEVRLPKFVPVSMKIFVSFRDGTEGDVIQNVVDKSIDKISSYLASLKMGGTCDLNEVERLVYDTSDSVVSSSVVEFTVNGRKVTSRQYELAWNEMFAKTDENNIQILY